MKEKCCGNCFYFKADYSPSMRPLFVCEYHGENADISHPDSQFCGDEHWVSTKVKTRIDNLEKLS